MQSLISSLTFQEFIFDFPGAFRSRQTRNWLSCQTMRFADCTNPRTDGIAF